MTTKPGGLGLEVRNHGQFSLLVLERATCMLRSLLEAASQIGDWRYDVMGPCSALSNSSQYELRLEPASSLSPALVHAFIRSSILPDGALMGMLRMPSGVDRTRLLQDMAPIAAVFNRNGWKSIIERETRSSTVREALPSLIPEKEAGGDDDESVIRQQRIRFGNGYLRRETPEEIREKSLRSVSASLPRIPGDSSSSPSASREIRGWKVQTRFVSRLETARAPSVLSAGSLRLVPSIKAPPVRPEQGSAHSDSGKETTMNQLLDTSKEAAPAPKGMSEEDERRHAQFLIELLKDAGADGVFSTGSTTTSIAQKFFPDRKARGLVSGLLPRLRGLRWIRKVGTATYRVERSFLVEQGLDRSFPRVTAQSETLNGHVNGAGHEVPKADGVAVSDLAQRLAAVGDLPAEREKLMATVALAEQVFGVAERDLEAARGALAAFDQQVQASLGPLMQQYSLQLR